MAHQTFIVFFCIFHSTAKLLDPQEQQHTTKAAYTPDYSITLISRGCHQVAATCYIMQNKIRGSQFTALFIRAWTKLACFLSHFEMAIWASRYHLAVFLKFYTIYQLLTSNCANWSIKISSFKSWLLSDMWNHFNPLLK